MQTLLLCLMLIAAVTALLLSLVGFKQQQQTKRHSPDVGDIEDIETATLEASTREPDDITITPGDYVSKPRLISSTKPHNTSEKISIPTTTETNASVAAQEQPIVFYVVAEPGELFEGYELIQTFGALHCHYGDGQLFHRHQHDNGHGPILFSVASANPPGHFDLNAIAGIRTTGLSVFMKRSHTPLDRERFKLMLETAGALAEELGGRVYDAEQNPLTEASYRAYHASLA